MPELQSTQRVSIPMPLLPESEAKPTLTAEQAERVKSTLTDPVLFCETWLNSKLAPEQEAIARSVEKNRKTAVKASHSTGKTYLSALLTLWWLARWKEAIVITTAPTKNQVEKLLWAEIHAALKRSRYPFPPAALTHLRMESKRYALGFTTNVEHEDEGVKFQGFHAAHVLVILDEAPGVEAKIWKAVNGILASGDTRLLAIGNPTIVGGDFYNAFTSNRDSWATFSISAFDTANFKDVAPNATTDEERAKALLKMGKEYPEQLDICPVPYLVSRRWVYDLIKELGWQHAYVQARVFGKFPTQSEDSLFSLSWLEQAKVRAVQNDTASPFKIRVGLDVAGPGDAETVLYAMRGRDIVGFKAWPEADPRGEVVAELRPLLNAGILETVNVDTIGIGYYMARHLEDNGFPVGDVNVGAKPNDEERFFNLKAEAYWGLRMRAESGDLAGLLDESTIAQLTTIRYKQNPRGQTVIESKDDARKRGVKSPDRAEALMLASVQAGTHGLIELWGREAEQIAKTKAEAPPFKPSALANTANVVKDVKSLNEAQKREAGWGDMFSENNDELQSKSGIKSLGKVMTNDKQPDKCPNKDCSNPFVSQYADKIWKCNHCGWHGIGNQHYVSGVLINN
jgi:hypothetical protein